MILGLDASYDNVTSGLEPLFHLTTTKKSVLDTLVTHKETRRPAYAILTHDSVTRVYKIDDIGHMSAVGVIQWDVSAGRHLVSADGRTSYADELLVKKGRFGGWGNGSRQFAAGGLVCKWKQTELHEYSPTVGLIGPRMWSCYDSTTSHAASPSSLIAVLEPPQRGTARAEWTVYPRGRTVVDMVVFTGILMAVNRHEWRAARSAHTKETLQRVLTQARESLPPYSPGGALASSVHRGSASRRPQTAPGVVTPSVRRSDGVGDALEPPPYASRVELSSGR